MPEHVLEINSIEESQVEITNLDEDGCFDIPTVFSGQDFCGGGTGSCCETGFG